jgi:KaiC/GvpD/RAD55 family RecA-like ATPase
VVRSELLRRSPLKILEKTAHGGPGKGGLAAVVARKGVGKTAFLVHLSTLELLEGKHVIHVSFASRTDHIVDWYEEIFTSIAQRANLEQVNAVHDEIVQRRVIMNFSQTGVPVDRIVSSLRSMIGQGHFCADLVIVDGYNFAQTDRAHIEAFKSFARDMNLEIWFSVSLPTEEQNEDPSGERQIPALLAPYADQFAIVMRMRTTEGHVSLRLLKDHDVAPVPDIHLTLDPKSLLVEE